MDLLETLSRDDLGAALYYTHIRHVLLLLAAGGKEVASVALRCEAGARREGC